MFEFIKGKLVESIAILLGVLLLGSTIWIFMLKNDINKLEKDVLEVEITASKLRGSLDLKKLENENLQVSIDRQNVKVLELEGDLNQTRADYNAWVRSGGAVSDAVKKALTASGKNDCEIIMNKLLNISKLTQGDL